MDQKSKGEELSEPIKEIGINSFFDFRKWYSTPDLPNGFRILPLDQFDEDKEDQIRQLNGG